MRRMIPVLIALAVAAAPASARQNPSPGKATLLSAGTTLAGVGLLVAAGQDASFTAGTLALAALTAGPSVGFFYAGLHRRGWQSLCLRTLANVTAALGLAWAFEHDSNAAAALSLVSSAVFTGSAIYDIATVGSAAARAGLDVSIDVRDRAVRLGAVIPF